MDYSDDLEVKPVINCGSLSIIQSALMLGQHQIYAAIGGGEKKLVECDSLLIAL